jgi:hypothetical protein
MRLTSSMLAPSMPITMARLAGLVMLPPFDGRRLASRSGAPDRLYIPGRLAYHGLVLERSTSAVN